MFRVALSAVLLTVALAGMPSCVLVAETGTRVELGLRVEPGEAVSADGVAITMAEAWLHVADARLVLCEERAAFDPRSLLGPAVARALHPNGAHLGEPQVVSLREPEAVLGLLQPATGRYCALEVFVTPSDELDDWALAVRGSAGDADFQARGFAMRTWRLPFAEPLVLTDADRTAAVTLVIDPAEAVGQVAVADRAANEVGLDLLLALEAGAEVRMGAGEMGG